VRARAALAESGFGPIDYFELRDSVTLEPLTKLSGSARLFVAARLGKTRLIDNLAVLAG
jgi:pantoate--beta-alanine ligase